MQIYGNLKCAFQLLVTFGLRHSLDVRARRACSCRVRASHRPYEYVRARHAAFLDDMLHRQLGITPGVELSNNRVFQD